MVVFGIRGMMTMVTALVATACAGQSVDHVSQEAILGDWILCGNGSCSALGGDGMRLRDDDVVQQLDTHAGPVVSPVCVVVTQQQRPYQFDGQYISMDGQRVELRLDGDRMTLIDLPVISSGDPAPKLEDVNFVRVTTYESTSCP